MNANENPSTGPGPRNATPILPSAISSALGVGIFCWVLLALGFVGLKILMKERPEFVGQPAATTASELIQDSPRVVMRKVSDDVSTIKPAQPAFSDVQFNMAGRRDYRGLRTTMDMSGDCHARYVLTNAEDEAAFVLFKCPHPRPQGDVSGTFRVADLRLTAPTNGTQDIARDAWVWSGTLPPHGNAAIEISYQADSLKGVNYRAGDQDGSPVRQLRVAFQRKDLDSLRFSGGDGVKSGNAGTVVWDRKDFLPPDNFSATIVETRSLFSSLQQLLEIGPIVCLLFLLSVSAVILTRQPLSAVQLLTITACYALYFPLILYLSVRFSFAVAVLIAAVVPGALLINYGRWLLGPRLGLMGGTVFLALFWVFPTLAAFAGWNRGMVLLCLGVVTLWVLINLQNQALRRKAAVVALLFLFACPLATHAAEVQVMLPAELAPRLPEPKKEIIPSVVAFDPIQYRVRHDTGSFHVDAEISFHVLRAGDTTVPLFNVPVHLTDAQVTSPETNLAAVVTVSNRLSLFVQKTGAGTLKLAYRVPLENREGKRRAQMPLLAAAASSVRLESPRDDFEILAGSLWAKETNDKATVYDIGAAGEDLLVAEWSEQPGRAPAPRPGIAPGALATGKPGDTAKDFYGIGVTRAQHLTVVNSDGSCTHFAEFEVPPLQGAEFRMKLPDQARLVSVSVNGNEVNSPAVTDQLCVVKLPPRDAQQAAHRLSFRLSYPTLRLGFIGSADLKLPELFQTAGTTEWIVALPGGFQSQILSSGLETQKSPPNFDRFGDYGRLLKSRPCNFLAGELTPPGVIALNLKYHQLVPGLLDSDFNRTAGSVTTASTSSP